MSTIGLVKGNPNDLLGRVFIYVENIDRDERKTVKYPALFVSVDPREVKEYDIYKLLPENFLERVGEYIKNKIDTRKDSHVRIQPFYVSTALDSFHVKKIAADVIAGGKVINCDMAETVLNSLYTVYLSNYSTQMIRNRIRGFNHVNYAGDNYKNYKGKELKEKLKPLIYELMYCFEFDDKIAESQTAINITNFMKGFEPSEIVDHLIYVVTENSPNKNRLTDLYLGLIGSIRDEDYLDAAKKQRELKRSLSRSRQLEFLVRQNI